MTRDEYQRNAIECMQLASQIDDPDNKLKMLAMARAWLMLANYGFMFDDTARIVAAATKPESPKEE